MNKSENLARIVLIEDDETIRSAFSYLINQSNMFKVVNTYSNAERAIKGIKSDDPHIVLLDIELPGMNGIEAIPKIKGQVENVYVLMLTVFEEQNKVFMALANGASGYLTKDTAPEKILEALKDVLAGGGPMSSSIAKMVVNSFQKNTDSPLTKRETEILEQISEGKTRSLIAKEMFIDLETVKSHLKNIYSKLSVHSRADAIKKAKKNRYI